MASSIPTPLSGSTTSSTLSRPIFTGLQRTLDQRVSIALESLKRLQNCLDPLARYEFLISMLYTDANLFFALALAHTSTIMPLVYTPLVGAACISWSHLSMPFRGLYISLEDKGNIANKLRTWPQPSVKAICVTDGERILGLGDLGANGMGIPVGKLALYTALAGVDPKTTLPITIDAGTNNASALADPEYIGLRQKRDSSQNYFDLIDEFVTAVDHVFGNECLIQWEDFGNSSAFVLLDRYRTKVPSFNDDIQGTAAVVLGGLLSAADNVDNIPALENGTYLFYGAGEAGVGIAELIAFAISLRTGKSVTEARRQIWLVDTKGLITAERLAIEGDKMAHHKQPYAHSAPIPAVEDLENANASSMLSFAADVRRVKPSAIIGVSAQPAAFTEEVIHSMAKLNKRPIIFALSNPTHKCECTAEQALLWSDGTAVFASGSPFDPLTVTLKDGKQVSYTPGQGNNSYIFPALGLACNAVKMSHMPDNIFYAAALALSKTVKKEEVLATGCIYPDLSTIRLVSAAVATAVAEEAYVLGVARLPRPVDIAYHIQQAMWKPESE
jgi:malate dehydrogenase (oxaloacetate-decarboxylating)(NADP+)